MNKNNNDKLLSIRIVKQKLNEKVVSGKKTYRSFISQLSHDFRFEKMDDDYLKRPNEENKYINFDILKNVTNKDYVENNLSIVENFWSVCNEKHKETYKKKIHKQTKPVLNFLISFSKDFDLPLEEREKQLEYVKVYVKTRFDFPLYLVQHNDEKALHYSFSVVNFDKVNNKPISKTIDTSKLQDDIADFLKKYNVDYGHNRGVPKTISLSQHRSILEGKVKELKDNEKKLKEEITSLKGELITQNQNYKDLIGQIEKVEHNVKYGLKVYEQVIVDLTNLGINIKGKNNDGLMKLLKRYLNRKDMKAFDKHIEIMIKTRDDTMKLLNDTNTQKRNSPTMGR